MAKPLITNNAYSTLAGSITSGDTTLTVASGQGSRFPAAATGGDYFYATLINASNELEIVKVTNRTADSFTIVRAQDGTSARGYSNGDRIELRPVAALFNEIRDSERTPLDTSVTTAKIDDGAVTTDKLNTDAVTTAKITDGAVTTAKIANEDVTVAKIEGGGSAAAGRVYVSDGDGTGTWGLADTLGATKDVTGADGYVKLPGGIILQWGYIVLGNYVTGGVFFSIPFPNAPFSIVTQQLGSGPATFTSGKVNTVTTGSFNLTNPNNGTIGYYWMAIGY